MNIIIAGDFAPYGRLAEAFGSGSQLDLIDEALRSHINHADYAIVNLEAPIIDKKCNNSIPYKINLSANLKSLEWLKQTGFDCVTLANNHIRDYLDEGVISSLDEIDKINMDRVGADKNLSMSKKIFYKEIDGKKLAIISVCENEFSVAGSRPGAAPLDMIDNYHQIIEARKNADFVLMIVHGGHEHYQLPSPRMKKTYEWFIELGVDAVVNHHQHCYSGIEVYKGKPIFYGIGNFCFDWPGRVGKKWNYGFLVELCFGKEITYKTIPYCQCDRELVVRGLNDAEQIEFNNNIKELSGIIQDENRLSSSFKKYCRSRYKGMELALTPYSGRITKGLFMRKLLPGFVTDNRRFFLYNYINCESHRDVLIDYLNENGIW